MCVQSCHPRALVRLEIFLICIYSRLQQEDYDRCVKVPGGVVQACLVVLVACVDVSVVLEQQFCHGMSPLTHIPPPKKKVSALDYLVCKTH